MNLIEEFVPLAGSPNLRKIWMQYGIALLIFMIPPIFIPEAMIFHLAGCAFTLILIVIPLIMDRSSVNVVISGFEGTFKYRTMDVFGKLRDTTVQLSNAKVDYKYTRLSKNRKGYCLRLYNNYFSNRITLKEGLDNTEFNVEQLNKMFELINKCKAIAM